MSKAFEIVLSNRTDQAQVVVEGRKCVVRIGATVSLAFDLAKDGQLRRESGVSYQLTNTLSEVKFTLVKSSERAPFEKATHYETYEFDVEILDANPKMAGTKAKLELDNMVHRLTFTTQDESSVRRFLLMGVNLNDRGDGKYRVFGMMNRYVDFLILKKADRVLFHQHTNARTKQFMNIADNKHMIASDGYEVKVYSKNGNPETVYKVDDEKEDPVIRTILADRMAILLGQIGNMSALMLLDWQTQKLEWRELGIPVYQILLTEQTLVGLSDRGLVFLHPKKGVTHTVPHARPGSCMSVTFDGRCVTGSVKGEIQCFEHISDTEPSASFVPLQEPIYGVELSDDGKTLVITYATQVAIVDCDKYKLFDTKSQLSEPVQMRFEAIPNGVHDVARLSVYAKYAYIHVNAKVYRLAIESTQGGGFEDQDCDAVIEASIPDLNKDEKVLAIVGDRVKYIPFPDARTRPSNE